MADPIRLTREELYERVWSEPVSALAKRFGLSDVGLKNICKRHDIPTPGLGYWAKLAHGKHVTQDRLPANTDRSRSTIVIQGHTDSLSSSNRRDTLALIEREKMPEYRVAIGPPGALRHPLTIATENALKKTKEAGWLAPPHGCLALNVSKEMLPRALSIMDAILIACEERGWGVVAEYPTPRRTSTVGTFWYPGKSWVTQMPSPRGAETAAIVLREPVAFSIVELSRSAPPTESERRAFRKQFPYSTGEPPMRSEPSGELRLEIAEHPRVTMQRRRWKDSTEKPLEELNPVLAGFVRMAAGLRADALRDARERRQQLLAARRHREKERQRKRLERDVGFLERGIERWQWHESAEGFLAAIREEAKRRQFPDSRFAEWLRWAEDYVRQRGMDAFFRSWETPPAGGTDSVSD